jgi:outer membrane immunogenic protein
MKRLLMAAVASLGLITASLPAAAADLGPSRMMPVKAPAYMPFNWGGWYAGLNLGGGFSDVSGVVFGGQIGYNWQFGQWVFGLETDIQFSGQDSDSVFTGGGATFVDRQELEWFGTFRGRLGYALWDRWLPYVTGGLAYGGRKASGAATGTLAGPYSADDTAVGWALGVGVDYAITPAWTARLEYLHVSLDSFTANYALGGGTAIVNYGRLDNDIVRGALNYRFMTGGYGYRY